MSLIERPRIAEDAECDEILELRAAELVIETGLDHADQVADAHLAAAELLLGEDDAGEAGDQRAVQVEERADLRVRVGWP